uniref:Uncharacterized protein n=1 Tax=Arundo donax TaxID=35708 RepID=A0A0A8Z9V1_ARUDO
MHLGCPGSVFKTSLEHACLM